MCKPGGPGDRVGTRLTDFATGSQSCFNNPDVRFISLNVKSHDAYKQGALPILADAREGLRALAEAGAKAGLQPRPAYVKEIARLKDQWKKQLDPRDLSAHSRRSDEPGPVDRHSQR